MPRTVTRKILCLMLNAAVILLTVVPALRLILTTPGYANSLKGSWFIFFTNDSALMAVIACAAVIPYLACGKPLPEAVRLFKFAASVSVGLTCVTVLVFLGPILGAASQFGGVLIYLHLVCPVLCCASCMLEGDRPISVPEALCGMLPMLLYAALYLRNVVFHGYWPDIYQFNTGRSWQAAAAIIAAGTLLLCMLLRFGHNRLSRAKQ